MASLRVSSVRWRAGLAVVGLGLASPALSNLTHPPDPTFELVSPNGVWSVVVRLETVHLQGPSDHITEYSLPWVPASVVLTNDGELFVFDSWGRRENEQGVRFYDASGHLRWHREVTELLDADQLHAARPPGVTSHPAMLWHNGRPELDAATSTVTVVLRDGNRLAISPAGTTRSIPQPVEGLTFDELAGRRQSFLHFGLPIPAHLDDLILVERRMFDLQPSVRLAFSLQWHTSLAWEPNGSSVVADQVLTLECGNADETDCSGSRYRCQAALAHAWWSKLLSGLPIDVRDLQAWAQSTAGAGMRPCPGELFTIAAAASVYPELGDAVQFLDHAAAGMAEDPRRHEVLSTWRQRLVHFGAAAGADIAALKVCLDHHLAFEPATAAPEARLKPSGPERRSDPGRVVLGML